MNLCNNIKFKFLLKKLFSNMKYNFIDISRKFDTKRTAIACGSISMNQKAYDLLLNKKLEKGDALLLSEVAAINAIKKTSEIILMSHNILIEHICISYSLDKINNKVNVYCLVKSNYKTGVEMEALFGVTVALLTIYDLTKYISMSSIISQVVLLFKDGGKNSNWINENYLPLDIKKEFMNININNNYINNYNHASVITISDRAYNKIYDDLSGNILCEKIKELNYILDDYIIVPDKKENIINSINNIIMKYKSNIIFLSGGSGISDRDVTYEALNQFSFKLIPGIGELLRLYGFKYNKHSWLSRCMGIIYKKTLILSLPGSPKAVTESINILKDLLPHSLELINKNN